MEKSESFPSVKKFFPHCNIHHTTSKQKVEKSKVALTCVREWLIFNLTLWIKTLNGSPPVYIVLRAHLHI